MEFPTDEHIRGYRPEKVVAMVNTGSGERSSASFVLEQLKKNLGSDAVFDLFPVSGGPPAIAEAKEFLVETQPNMVIVAGGDGTVSLAMDITDSLRKSGKIDANTAPIAVLPMGTGNDLSRSLGFGGGYSKPVSKARKNFEARLDKIFTAQPQMVDRFLINIHVKSAALSARSSKTGSGCYCGGFSDTKVTVKTTSHMDSTAAAVAKEREPGNPMIPPLSTESSQHNDGTFSVPMTNYFSVGFDATVASNFGEFRHNNPEMCQSRAANKLWYGCFGLRALSESSSFPKNRLKLIIDGVEVKVPSNAKALIVGNMITYAAGTVLWKDSKSSYQKPAVDDKLVEVTSLDGVWHLVGVRMHTQSATKLGQGTNIELHVPANYVMQYDGEPIPSIGDEATDAIIHISHLSQSLGMRINTGVIGGDEYHEDVVPLHNEEEHSGPQTILEQEGR